MKAQLTICRSLTKDNLGLLELTRYDAMPQSIADSCRHLTEAEWSKQDDTPPEFVDEIKYNCGDAATSKEADPYALQSSFLYNLLEPAVVRFFRLSFLPVVCTTALCECSLFNPQAMPFPNHAFIMGHLVRADLVRSMPRPLKRDGRKLEVSAQRTVPRHGHEHCHKQCAGRQDRCESAVVERTTVYSSSVHGD